MKNFNRGDRSGGRGDFGNRGGDRRPDMHKAICDDCGNSCEVPFKPTADKPVYCSDCFSSRRNSGGGGGGFSQRDERREKKMFSAICVKCGKNCEVPFRPTGEKPVYCSQCFGKNPNVEGSKSSDQYKEDFAKLNSKLDKIMQALNISVSVGLEPKKEVAPQIKKENASVVPINSVPEKKSKTKDEKKKIKIIKEKEAKKAPSTRLRAGKKEKK